MSQVYSNKVSISPNAIIGEGVRIGDGTVIHDGVEIGAGSVIGRDCTIGEPLAVSFTDGNYVQPSTVIGQDAIIRSHAIIYAGSTFGDGFQTGHHAVIREFCTIGNHCSVGTFADLQGHIVMGEYCRLHSSVHLAQGTNLGSYVFLYPFVVTTNDRFPPTTAIVGPVIGDYTQVGVHAVILAGVQVGAHCLIGANATVNRDVADYSFMVGSPAVRKGDVRELKDADGAPLYPWPARFDRGMPWKNDL
jgi:acetyltransferase-like isoleucine patch superfamily enzyme